MQSFIDDTNNVQAEVVTANYVLAERGWRSPTTSGLAASGIAQATGTFVNVVIGVDCGLADLNDLEGC